MSEPTKEELYQLQEQDTPEMRAYREKRRQARKKLGLLADQVRKHAKATETYVYIFGEGEPEGTVTEAGYFSSQVLQAMIMHISQKYPGAIEEAQKRLADFAGAQEEPKPKLIIEP